MLQTHARHQLRRAILVALVGGTVAFAAVACTDAGANGSTDSTASPTPTAATTPAETNNESPPNGTGTPGGGDSAVTDDGTPVTGGATPSPDSPVSSTPGGSGSMPNPGPTVAPVDPGYPTVEELAPIESVDILAMESFPVQYAVSIVSGLPSGCAAFAGAEVVERSGTAVRIEVLNTMPAPDANLACTMIYGLHESNVALGTDFQSGVTYTVDVNGTITEFTAQ